MSSPRRTPSLLESFNFAFEGIIHVLRTQRNMRLHFLVAIGVLVAALSFDVGRMELIALLLAIAFVLIAEMVNTAIEGAIRPFGPVRWIDDAGEWQTDDLRPTIEGSAILGVGEPTIDGDIALVPVSLWCGGLCATWLTYRIDRIDGTWQVRGTEGPIAIA